MKTSQRVCLSGREPLFLFRSLERKEARTQFNLALKEAARVRCHSEDDRIGTRHRKIKRYTCAPPAILPRRATECFLEIITSTWRTANLTRLQPLTSLNCSMLSNKR